MLKRIQTILVLCVMLGLASTAFSQAPSQDLVINNVRIAVKSGDSRTLSTYFSNIVELKTDKEAGGYSKNQAEFVLKNFFRKYPAISFMYNHVGSSANGSKFTIGTYRHASGSFRVYTMYKKVGETFLIDTIEFTKE